jgi:hypothetical protein
VIARIWRGRVPVERADRYLALMTEVAIPDYRAVQGNLGAWCLRRQEDGLVEFQMLTLWTDVDAVKRFAGEDYELARYYDFDDAFLVEKELRAHHFDVHGEALAGQVP